MKDLRDLIYRTLNREARQTRASNACERLSSEFGTYKTSRPDSGLGVRSGKIPYTVL